MPNVQNYAQFLASFASDKFQTLWPAQAHILENYVTTYEGVSDVAVELPTGAGKTLIALLIAEAQRQANKKVAILSANKTLAKQMVQEAKALGIPVVLMEGPGSSIPSIDKRAYQRAKSIAVMNYWVYFNQNPIIDPADVLFMDDAHLAEHCLHSLYSVEIDRISHNTLFKTLIIELQQRFPEYTVFDDALTDDAPPAFACELLSFLDQRTVEQRFREIVDASPSLQLDKDLSFRWNRLRLQLGQANIYVSPNTIWIRPYIYPLLSNPHYEQTHQRLYLSATVGDPDDLSRRLGTKTIDKIPVPPIYMEATSGRRMVVMGGIEENSLSERLVPMLRSALSISPKILWLCVSKAEAEALRRVVSEWLNSNGFVGHPTWILSPLGDEIDTFKQAPHGHLFVAGRFDGMDFHADECRIVVLTQLPRATNLQEEFIAAHLRDAGFIKRRLNQRIVQALGRCNRSEEDYGLYILGDNRFATHFSSEANRKGLSRNLMAEIDMAQDAADRPLNGLLQSIERFLKEDFQEYDQEMHTAFGDVPEVAIPLVPTDPVTPGSTSEKVATVADEVLGWNALFASQNYAVAANRFEACWEQAKIDNLLEIGAFYGWQWAKALYLQSWLGEPGAYERSLTVLDEAIKRGGQSSWFNRMRGSINRARQTVIPVNAIGVQQYSLDLLRAFDEHLDLLGTRGNKFESWCQKTRSLLLSTSHKEMVQGLERLGKLLGYHVVLPRNQAATDCLWRGRFGDKR